MHEHGEICLNTCLNCHKVPTQIQTQQMGLSPIKILEGNFHKFKNPNPFSKNPQFLNPNLNFYIILEKHEENVLENIP